MLGLVMTLNQAARQAEKADQMSSNEPGPVPRNVPEAGDSFLDAEVQMLRLGLPREFAA